MSSPVSNAIGISRSAGGPGSLDRSFGKGGTEIVPIEMNPVAAAVDDNGLIVVAGDIGESPGQIAVVRLRSNGKLDKTFGSRGVAKPNLYTVSSLTLLPDGKILLGGTAASGAHAALVQLASNGTLDTSFGNGGEVTFDYVANSSNAVLAVVVSATDGSIIAGGFGLATTSDDYLTSLARFDSQGNIDKTFGTDGIVAVDLVGGVTALGLQSNRKILVCGGFITGAKSLVVRFNENGTLDKTDRGGTLVTVAHTGSTTFEGTNEFAIDGKLLQWESVENYKQSRHYVRVVRRLRDNSHDPHFRSPRFSFDSTLLDRPNDVEIASSGELLVGGYGSQGANEVFGLARLTENGALDDSFGKKGRVVTAFSGQAGMTALAIDPSSGNIVGAGTVSGGGSSFSLALARYLGN